MRELPHGNPGLRSNRRGEDAAPEPGPEQFRTGLRRQAALIYLSKKAALKSTPSSRLLADVCRIAARAMNADHVHVLELLPDRRTLIARAAAGWSPDWLAQWRMDVAPSSRLGRALRRGGMIPLVSAHHDAAAPAGEELLGATRMHCGLAFGIAPHGRVGALVGVYFGSARRFSPDEVQFVRTVSLLVESALRNEARITMRRLASADHAASQAELLRLIVSRLRPALRESVEDLWKVRAAALDSFTVRRALKSADTHMADVADFLEDLSVLADLLEGRLNRRDQISVGAILVSLVEQLRSRAGNAGVHLRLLANDDFLIIRGDAALFRRALLNLLENALKFTPAEGRITLALTASDASTGILEIVDSGRGMSRSQLEQLSAGRRPSNGVEGSGAGIGWRLASAIIHRHGGTLTATSAGSDCGTTVTIRLARQPAAEL